MTRLYDKLAYNKNDSSKPFYNGNSKIGFSGDKIKYAQKLENSKS